MKNPQRTVTALVWRTSSYSGGNNECVEVAYGGPGYIPVRDSRRQGGPIICFGRKAWVAFLSDLR